VTWTYIILLCFFFEFDIIVCCYIVAFCIINLMFSFVNKRKVFLKIYTLRGLYRIALPSHLPKSSINTDRKSTTRFSMSLI